MTKDTKITEALNSISFEGEIIVNTKNEVSLKAGNCVLTFDAADVLEIDDGDKKARIPALVTVKASANVLTTSVSTAITVRNAYCGSQVGPRDGECRCECQCDCQCDCRCNVEDVPAPVVSSKRFRKQL